jgi:5'-nucleotidase
MKILLTNDDGFASAGIGLLAQALRAAGHRVLVLAPASNRSGASHSISFLDGPCKLIEIEKDTWSCSGTPADCVVLALLGGIPELRIIPAAAEQRPAEETGEPPAAPPDLILSGINRGANLGTDIVYSGTAAAARQGSLIGIPAIALSLVEGEHWHWDMAVSFVVNHLDAMLAFWQADTFVNVNIPNSAAGPSGLVPAFPSLRYYNDRIETYRTPDGACYCFARAGKIGAKAESGSDWDVVSLNGASMSAIYIHPRGAPPEAAGGRGAP